MEEQEKVQKEFVDNILTKLDNKDFGLYFFTLDTRGNAAAGIANIYEHVKLLRELGYNANILHEKNDYKLVGDAEGMGIADWLGEEYAELPHVSIETQGIKINAEDFLVVPEIFANVMDQAKKFPCKKIVFSQNYDYLLELLPLGRRWSDYGFNDVITTSQKQADYISSLFPSTRSKVIPVSIPEYFKPSDKPKIPVVTICTREQGVAAKIAKMFYLQYPLYKWITFKELRNLSREQFATELGKSCLSVWVDDSAGFGTFPLEAMQSNTPVIGKMPNMIPEWMEETDEEGNKNIKNNGVWTNTHLNIPELIATYLKVWLEDSVPQDLIEGIESSKNIYTTDNQKAKVEEVYGSLIEARKEELNNTIKVLETKK
tara:strand:+ start:172 stop:1290 length:1119 start_codon:yes stop_codon:yes gene_type:complete